MTSEQQRHIDDNIPESHVKLSISADEVNLLIYRYLLEAGFRHTAFTFEAESKVPQTSPFATTQIPPGALVSLLQKALIYLYIQSHCGKNGEQLRCEGSFSLLRPHEHVIPSTTVSEVDEEYSNAVTLRKDDMKTTISSSSRGRGNRTETDDTSIEDDEEEDDVRQGRRQQQQHRRKSGIDIDDDTPESGGGSTSSSPRSKRRRRRRIIQEGEDDDDEDEEDDDDVEMGYDIKDGNIDDDDEDDDSSSIAGSRMSKGVEDVDYDGDNKKTKNTKKEEEKVEEYMMKDDETVEAAVEASSSSQPQVVEANSSTTAAAAVGVVGDGVEEGSIVGPKIRKRGRLVTAGPLGIIEDNKIEEVEEDIQLKEVEKEDGDGEREDDIDDDDKLPIMPLVYQLLDPSRDTSSLHCPSPVLSMQWSPSFDDLLATANSDGQLSLFWSPSSSRKRRVSTSHIINEDNSNEGDNNNNKVEWNAAYNNSNNNVIGYLMVDGPTTTTTTKTNTDNTPVISSSSTAAAGTSTTSQIYLSWSPKSVVGSGGEDEDGRCCLYTVIAMASESSPIIRLRWIKEEDNNRGYSVVGRYDINSSRHDDDEIDDNKVGGYHSLLFCGAGRNNNTTARAAAGGGDDGDGSSSMVYLSGSCDNESIVIWQVNCSIPNDIPQIMLIINDTPSFSLTWIGSTYLAVGTLSPYLLLIDTRDNTQKKLLINDDDEAATRRKSTHDEDDEDEEGECNDGIGGGGGNNRFILECVAYYDEDGIGSNNNSRLAAITDSEPTDAYITVWMDPTARRPGKPIILKPGAHGSGSSTSSSLQVQEMLRWMPGSNGNILCACYEGGIVVVWDIIKENILYTLPCIDTITAISWQNNNIPPPPAAAVSAAYPLLVTLIMGRKCLIWSEGKIISAFDLRCDDNDDNAFAGCIAWSYNDNYLATNAGGNETPLIFDVTPIVIEE